MEDQATRLRKLIESKLETRPVAQPVSSPKITSENAGEFMPRVIAVTSGKGGVGKTNLTVNLAIALGMAGKRVMVIDADLGMANVDVVLGTVSKYNLLNLLQDGITLQDVLLQGPYGVNYISGGSGLERLVDFSPQEQAKLLGKLSVCELFADIILLDTGAGLGRNVMDFLMAAEEVILVTTPEPTALTDAYAVMKTYSRYSTLKNMRLVVNRVYDEAEGKDVVTKLRRTSERFLQMSLTELGFIYEDRNVMRAIKKQTPFMIAYPNTVASQCVQALASNLLYGSKTIVKQGWRGFLNKFF